MAEKTKFQYAKSPTGALSGAGFAAGAAAFVNAIPVGGQIAYGGAVLIGTAVGALGAGAEMFSETDCEMDPVLGKYACCNISKLSNIDAYRAEIGDRMFTDTFPYVRYCVQGKKEFKDHILFSRKNDKNEQKNLFKKYENTNLVTELASRILDKMKKEKVPSSLLPSALYH